MTAVKLESSRLIFLIPHRPLCGLSLCFSSRHGAPPTHQRAAAFIASYIFHCRRSEKGWGTKNWVENGTFYLWRFYSRTIRRFWSESYRGGVGGSGWDGLERENAGAVGFVAKTHECIHKCNGRVLGNFVCKEKQREVEGGGDEERGENGFEVEMCIVYVSRRCTPQPHFATASAWKRQWVEATEYIG